MDFTKPKMQQIFSPPLIVLYGGPGIGKTSFGIGADKESNYLIGKENHLLINIDFRGADRLTCTRASDILKRPIASTDDIKAVFQGLAEQNHPFEWVVFDDLSTLEEILVKEVCQEYDVDELKKIDYGRGYELAKTRWYQFFNMIKELQEMKPIGVILIAHTKVENQKDPMTESYSRHNLQLDKRSREIILKSVDLIGFAHKKTFTKEVDSPFRKKDNKEKVAIGKAERVLTFSPDTESFESKDRFQLTEEISLDWSVFLAELQKSMERDNNTIKKTTTKEKK